MPVTNYHTVNGMIIGETTSGVRRGYLPDALGSVVATVDDNGSIENTYRYKPYGSLLAKTGTAADPRFMWTGAIGSLSCPLAWSDQYNQARHYGCESGCFTSVDTLWPGEDTYMYAKGNPVTQSDPDGRACTIKLLGTVHNLRCKAACFRHTFCGIFTHNSCEFDYRYHASFRIYLSKCTDCRLYQWYQDRGHGWVRDDADGWPVRLPPGNGMYEFHDYPGDTMTGDTCRSHHFHTEFATCVCCKGVSKCVKWSMDSKDTLCRSPICTPTGPTLISQSSSDWNCKQAIGGSL